jgi:hypothetical protein
MRTKVTIEIETPFEYSDGVLQDHIRVFLKEFQVKAVQVEYFKKEKEN